VHLVEMHSGPRSLRESTAVCVWHPKGQLKLHGSTESNRNSGDTSKNREVHKKVVKGRCQDWARKNTLHKESKCIVESRGNAETKPRAWEKRGKKATNKM